MSENKKENIENIKPSDTDSLNKVTGGIVNELNDICPKCGFRGYDTWTKKCDICGYKG